MHNKFLAQIDRGVRKASPINYLVDTIINKVLPNIEARATCGQYYCDVYGSQCASYCDYSTCRLQIAVYKYHRDYNVDCAHWLCQEVTCVGWWDGGNCPGAC